MKTSRSQKDPLLPDEVWLLLPIVFIAVISGLLLPWITAFIEYLKK